MANDIKNGANDNPKIEAKVMSDGNRALYLNFYLGRYTVVNENGETVSKVKRQRRALHLVLINRPKTPLEKEQNRKTIELAKRLRYEAEQEFNSDKLGYRVKLDKTRIDFLQYFANYLARYTKADKPNMKQAYTRFCDFLRDTDEYSCYCNGLPPTMVNTEMIDWYIEYLQSRSRGVGASSIYERFKKFIAYAVEHDVLKKNPCLGKTIKRDNSQLSKAVLSLDEIAKLEATPASNEAVKRAFLFCCYCGLRWCDVAALTYANVDSENRLITFEQKKTAGHSSHSGVTIPVTAEILALVGSGKPSQFVFDLPTYNGARLVLMKWLDEAGIGKHITWHCARHSFATNALTAGANIKVVADILGHSTLTHTQRYLRAVDSAKREAIENLFKK